MSVFLTLLVISAFPGTRAESVSPASFGMTMTTRAYDAVCWYEALKVFPDTITGSYCGGYVGASQIQAQVEHPDDGNKDYFESYPDAKTTMYGTWLMDMGTMDLIPNATLYKDNCAKYLKDPHAQPASDESGVLNDYPPGPYPYQAFAYCMLATLWERHGQKAIEDVKNERTITIKDWRDTLFDRDNELRKRHGVPPLQRMSELDATAQAWSEENAQKCDSHHSPEESRQMNGAGVGENLFTGQGNDDPSVAALQSSDSWYTEISNYPYPNGFQGNVEDFYRYQNEKEFGYFTQQVWKESQYVGYGYAYSCGKYFVTARYFPSGNVVGEFTKNVLPQLF